MVRILQAAGVRFGILGREESCCGDGARRLGNEALFRSLREKNMGAFKKYHIRKIVCLCPHGYNTLKNEYHGDFEVIHGVPFVLDLIKKGKISLKYPENMRMAIHDPCYLGRVNGIYDSLREAIASVPGIELRELARNRENALCCGGGGGRMWLHESLGQNINRLRAQDVAEAGVNLVGTACPYCLTMLEDGINALEMEKPPRVMDLVEIVVSAMGRVY
jgi:Fe-S oxidoreductase